MLARAACESFCRRVRCVVRLRFTESSARCCPVSRVRSTDTCSESVTICSICRSRMAATSRRLVMRRAT